MKMKKVMTIFGVILFASAILTSCGGGSNDKNDETIVQETTETKIDSLGGDTTNKTTVNEITPANLTVKIFFRDLDMSGYEGYEDFKPRTYNIIDDVEFSKTNKYTFCYDSAEFNSLQISGIGEKLTLVVKEGNKVIYSKSEFDIKDKLRFTTKDFNLDGGPTYTITINQNDKRLFKGIIDSQGCM